jgi:hypothetical protein
MPMPRADAWGGSDIGGDPIVAVLTERVCAAHLAIGYKTAEAPPDIWRQMGLLKE